MAVRDRRRCGDPSKQARVRPPGRHSRLGGSCRRTSPEVETPCARSAGTGWPPAGRPPPASAHRAPSRRDGSVEYFPANKKEAFSSPPRRGDA